MDKQQGGFKIKAGVDPKNIPSIRFIEEKGFVR